MTFELAPTPHFAVDVDGASEAIPVTPSPAQDAQPPWIRPVPARLRTALHLGVLLAFCVIGAAIVWIRASAVGNEAQQAVRLEARALAVGLATAMAHQDRPALTSHLESLALRQGVVAVSVFDAQGRPLAAFGRSQGAYTSEIEDPPGALAAALTQQFPAAMRVHETVRNATEVLGTVILDADLGSRWRALYAELSWTVAILMAVLLICAAVVNAIQRRICEPLHGLARNCKVIAEDRDYTLRAWKSARDDVGTIVDCLNHLLDEIQRRGRALIEARSATAAALAARPSQPAKVTVPAAEPYGGQFLANMCHEIRTPLNRLQTLAAQLATSGLPREQSDHVSGMREASDSVIALVDDILGFTRIRGGTLELRSMPFDPGEALASAIQPYMARAAAKRLTLTATADPALPRQVQGDGARLRRVIGYLVAHSIKYAPSGSIVVEMDACAMPDEHVRLDVRVLDSGIGIAEAARQRIHEALTSASSETESAMPNGATGLGLYIANHLVRRMGGNLQLCELEMGSGFEFFVILERGTSQAGSQASSPWDLKSATPASSTIPSVAQTTRAKPPASPDQVRATEPHPGVGLDSDLSRELVEVYLDSAPDLLEQLAHAIRTRESEQIVASAHTLGACSARVGANELADLCKKVGSRAQQPGQLTRYIKSLSTAYERAQQALRNDVAEAGAPPQMVRSRGSLSSTLN